MKTQIRLLLVEQSEIRVCTVCHSMCTVWQNFSMEKPFYLNFRLIIANILGVRKFRTFTVVWSLYSRPYVLQVSGYLKTSIILYYLNFLTPENFVVIYLKFKQRGKTFGYFTKKMQMEKQTVKTLIRLLLWEQSDLGLHCLLRPVCTKLWIITLISTLRGKHPNGIFIHVSFMDKSWFLSLLFIMNSPQVVLYFQSLTNGLPSLI